MDLFVAEIIQTFHLVHYLVCRSTLFAPPGIRNDAKRAKLVTAFDDRNKSNVRRASFYRRDIPRFTFRSFVEIDKRMFTLLQPLDHCRNAIGGACSYDHI